MDDSDWDTDFFGRRYGFDTGDTTIERRHSGWAAVEKKWTQSQAKQVSIAEKTPPSKEYMEIMSKLHPGLSLPPPQLEVDFRMKVMLDTNAATTSVDSESRSWTSFIEGVWSGSLGTGSIVGGGQDSIDMLVGTSRGTQVESTFQLKTNDEPPAFIECKARGFRTGSDAIMNSLEDLTCAQSIDPRQYRHRAVITMSTNDPRYAERVNVELWVGTCLWRGSEFIYDAYKIR